MSWGALSHRSLPSSVQSAATQQSQDGHDGTEIDGGERQESPALDGFSLSLIK
jgi:hypothetical protein